MDIHEGVYYKDYLQLDKILNAQDLESDKVGKHAHDEMLFIIIHQTYEMWFKQMIFEAVSVAEIFDKGKIDDNSDDLQTVVHRLKRIVTILRVLIQQVDVLETMTPMDFLEFRDILRPASGFQSYQFKIMESLMGLKIEERHGLRFYMSHLKAEEHELIAKYDKETSLIEHINIWLERLPVFENQELWQDYKEKFDNKSGEHPFWNDYYQCFVNSLQNYDANQVKVYDQVFVKHDPDHKRRLSPKASKAALFIMLYRDLPIFHLPFQLINTLLDIDEQLAIWRFRHIQMVHRMIGTRTGTGGSSGKDYLSESLNKHYVFKEIADLTSFMIDRKSLPKLPNKVKNYLVYSDF